MHVTQCSGFIRNRVVFYVEPPKTPSNRLQLGSVAFTTSRSVFDKTHVENSSERQ